MSTEQKVSSCAGLVQKSSGRYPEAKVTSESFLIRSGGIGTLREKETHFLVLLSPIFC